jgi:2-dehydro-3-deoxygluconokinase
MSRVVAIGEVQVELSRGGDGRYGLSFGGGCFSAALHLARLGVPTALATVLGDDPYSRAIVATAKADGMATDLIVHLAGRKPDLAVVETGSAGERHLQRWRDGSPARHLFGVEGWGGLAEAMTQSRLVYLSGATLALFDNVGIGRMLATLEVARERGARVAFDARFHPADWNGDIARARAIHAEALRRVDIALAVSAGDASLFDDATPAAMLDRLAAAAGIGEIVLGAGAEGLLLRHGEETRTVAAPVPADSAAGDAFNAGYLAARLADQPPEAAVLAGQRLAGAAAAHRDAGPARKGGNGTANGHAESH